jgi:hypothetical protein
MDFAMMMATFAGIVLVRILEHDSCSQMYFILAVYPYALAFGIRCIYECYRPQKARIMEFVEKKNIKGSLYIIIGGIAGAILVNGFCINGNISMKDTNNAFERGVEIFTGSNNITLEGEKNYKANYLDAEEYEGYIWVKDHTPLDAVVTCNYFSIDYGKYPYLPGALTERRMLVPPYPYMIEPLVYGDENYLQVLKEADVSYVIMLHRISADVLEGKEGITKVFSNQAVTVYSVD